ncbi:MAG: CehA/McbA family metallohydrolase [Pyrinomonadaceae bacterium]
MLKVIISLILLLIPLLASAQTFEKKINIPPLKESDNRYFYVPFKFPAGAKSLSVSYEYDKKNGANVLDLGVFDSCVSKSKSDACGFRGWSGGRRNVIFISETTATNGYVAGKLPVGEWRVILGLYKIASEGVEVMVKVKINEIDAQAAQQFADEKAKIFDFPKSPRSLPLQADGLTWFRGDLHMHTFHSDGSWNIKGILDYAAANNLDFVGITDHNTFSHHAELDALAPAYKNLLVMRGEEVTTYGGHFNVWGLPSGKWIDFRVMPKDSAHLQSIVDDVNKLGLAFSINHPTALCGGCDWSYGDEMWRSFSSVEIWNGSWDFQDEAALKKWDDMLRSGKRVRAIGSSDSHSPPAETNAYATNLAIGTPTNFVGAKQLTQKDILTAIKSGRVWIAENPTYNLNFSVRSDSLRATIGDVLSVSAGKTAKFEFSGDNFPVGATVTLVSRDGVAQKLILDKANFVANFMAKPSGNNYFRLEVRNSTGKMLAFTNPIYLQTKA